MMNRRENRVNVAMESSISDGTHMFNGIVSNISRNGLKLIDIPKKFDTSSACVTVISGKGRHFKFHVLPRWQKEDAIYKEIGLKIISPSLKWQSFLKDLEYSVI
ncbi:MAG: PilZ domain-containing protein [Desulfobulbaceae bacterium]|uniref:PilZ domain-containing protein n=1 Tax=Candidatus Desulfobia pelagia TaxID=2841692 RepID=A0A8J6NA04_9BACT|nr:PilZ domain-containing protein [Candidatus Desulfobia pelagia]